MGMRGNLVWVHDEGYDLYYCHWCASTLPETLFWGPRFAEIFIKDQKPADGILLKESDHDPIKGVQLLFQKLDEEGQEVTAVNPNLWDYNPLTLNIEVKREIFERALMAWRADKPVK